ncbi:MAG: hypothetical protein K2X03_09960 [Bryobacteraceae bacterium]|nr:hypothetical protein [Bryobacteraceae bacterium]
MLLKPLATAVLACTPLCMPLHADFSYQETTKITGGSLTRMMRFIPGAGKALDAKSSAVYLKGDRLVHAFPDTMSIIDLSAETITEVNLEKKTYATITFTEMREAMERMAAKMQEAMSKQKSEPMPQMDLQVSVKRTGQTRSISGLDTREYLMQLAMSAQAQPGAPPAGVSDMEMAMWMTTKIPGYDEVQAFHLRMAQKMKFTPNLNPLLMQQRGSADGLKKMAEEMAKLDGTPVMTVTRIKGTGAMPGMPPGNASAQDNSDKSPRLGGGLAGLAAGGIMGGLRRKNKDAPKPEDSAAPAAKTADDVMIEMQTESSNFSNAPIDASKLSVPAGFQAVDHPMKKR